MSTACGRCCATRSCRSPPDLTSPVLALLRDLAAAPRPTGSAAIATARDRCTRDLKDLGFIVAERPFAFSAFPGRLGTPLLGALNASCVGLAGLWALSGKRFTPSAILLIGIVTTVIAGRWMLRHGVLRMPLLREQGVNLEATNGGAAPRVWLCAHVDTKSQPIPTLIRSAGVVFEAFGVVMATVLALAESVTGVGVNNVLWLFAGIVTLLGAAPVMMSMVGTRSPGALDNASGVAAVIAAARALRGVPGVGVLITDAEELGLAGARAWAVGRGSATVINCDGVDDRGELAVMTAGLLSPQLERALASAGPVSVGPHFPGVLTDAVALAGSGLQAVTVSRGSIRSLLRVHSRRDDLAHLRGDGIEATGVFIAAATRTFLGGTT